MDGSTKAQVAPSFGAAEIGALAHLYRGEVYRSMAWRTRLDTTTNWAVVTTGISLSVTFSGPDASPLPIILVSLLVVLFMLLEARRYRYFDLWRNRAGLIETRFFAPMLEGDPDAIGSGWTHRLAEDYRQPHYHLDFLDAIGRRLRRNYSWILLVQALSYFGKLAIHPDPLTTAAQVWERAAVGPIPGKLMILAGLLFHSCWIVLAVWTLERERRRNRRGLNSLGGDAAG
jgi:uncharacterized membrane protein